MVFDDLGEDSCATAGSFFCIIPKAPLLLSSLPLLKARSQRVVDEVGEVLVDKYNKTQDELLGGGHPTGLQKQHGPYRLSTPAGGIVVRPSLDPGSFSQPYAAQDEKDRIVVMCGALSNLGDLSSPGRLSGGSTADATTSAILNMYDRYPSQELLMLSELQGSYAFVLIDSQRKQAFAARDPGGTEELYFSVVHEDGATMFTNSLQDLPPWSHRRDWHEIPPGCYVSGKEPSLKQFALTPAELAARERAEELLATGLEPQGSDAHSASTSLGRPSSVEGSGGGTSLGRAMSLLAGVFDLSPPGTLGRGSSPPAGTSPSVETGLLKSLSKRRSTGDGRGVMPGMS